MSQIMIPYISSSFPHHEKTIISALENFTSKRGKAKTKQKKPQNPIKLQCSKIHNPLQMSKCESTRVPSKHIRKQYSAISSY